MEIRPLTGKWSILGVPHKGWTCTSVEDLGAQDKVCQMCETQHIRYAHHMEHPDHPESLAVGCVCAGHMENDYQGPRRRETAYRNTAQRRRRWLSRKWKVSANGNDYLNTDGLHIVVFQKNPRLWGARIEDRATGRSIPSRRPYQTEDAAKLAAFDAMIFLKTERGWGL